MILYPTIFKLLIQASELISVSKALVSALGSVATMAQTSPKMMVASAKMAVSTIAKFSNAANSAASSCPDPEAAKVKCLILFSFCS